MNCKADVPPQFVAAIKNNSCPGCGEAIFNEETQTLLSELRDAMTKMPNDAEGLAGWLITNYQLTKIGDLQPTQQFYKKIEKDDSETLTEKPKKKYMPKPISRSEDNGESSVSEAETTDFMRRTGIQPKSSKDLQSAASQIINMDDIITIDDKEDIDMNEDVMPLENSEINDVSDIFNEPPSQILELERLKRLRRSNAKI